MGACWYHNPKERPTFSEIRRSLEKSSFNVLNMEQFKTMKKNWQSEIEHIWENLNQKEKQLNVREKKTRQKEQEIKRKEQEMQLLQKNLEQQKKELFEKNIELAKREMAAILNNNPDNVKQKKKSTKKKLIISGAQISYPQNVCHNLTITTRQHEDALPTFSARALNLTCKTY